MHYVFFLLGFNLFVILGIFTLDAVLASQNDRRVADHKPILSSIDGQITGGEYSIALGQIDIYYEPNGLGGFQMGLAARRIICLSQLNRHADARKIIDRLVDTFPAVKIINDQEYFKDKLPDRYVQFAELVVDAAQQTDEDLSYRMPVGSAFSYDMWFKGGKRGSLLGLNAIALALYAGWRKRRQAKKKAEER